MEELFDYLRIGEKWTEPNIVDPALGLPAEHARLLLNWGAGNFLNHFDLLASADVAPYGTRIATAQPRLARQIVFATTDWGAMFAWDSERSIMTYISDDCRADDELMDLPEPLDRWPLAILDHRFTAAGVLTPFYVPFRALPCLCRLRALCAPDDFRTAHDRIRHRFRDAGYVALIERFHVQHLTSVYGSPERRLVFTVQTVPAHAAGRSVFDSSLRMFCEHEREFEAIQELLQGSDWVVGEPEVRHLY